MISGLHCNIPSKDPQAREGVPGLASTSTSAHDQAPSLSRGHKHFVMFCGRRHQAIARIRLVKEKKEVADAALLSYLRRSARGDRGTPRLGPT